MTLNCGDVIIRKNHVGNDGYTKDRWFLCAGKFRRNFKEHYMLLYCTTSSTMFPRADIECSEDYTCYKCPPDSQFESEDPTFISFLSPSIHNSTIMCSTIDSEIELKKCILKFKMSTDMLVSVLECALNSRDLVKGHKKAIAGELEFIKVFS